MYQEDHRGISDLLHLLQNKGVQLWCSDGQLRYRAPKGVVSGDLAERLRTSRERIVASLQRQERRRADDDHLRPRVQGDVAPLTFSQLAHWNQRGLAERRVVRSVACAMHLRGRLDIALLRASLSEVVRRHEALRTRLVQLNGMPMQKVDPSWTGELRTEVLTGLPERVRESELQLLIEQLILEPVDVAVGPLFQARLICLDERSYVLAVAMEHTISDAVSLGILRRDLLSTYAREQGIGVPLAPVPIQIADYAVWQRDRLPRWLKEHGGYWDERLKGARRIRFPDVVESPRAHRVGWDVAPFTIDCETKVRLHEFSRRHRTTPVMTAFAAYVGFVLRWCAVRDLVVGFQTDGRTNHLLQHTIGYLASVLHLRISLDGSENFSELISRVTEEYWHASSHSDLSYIDSQSPLPEFASNTVFNWIPDSSGAEEEYLHGLRGALTCSQFSFSNPFLKVYEKDSEPTTVFCDTGREVRGNVYFSRRDFTALRMQRFARGFVKFLAALIQDPEQTLGRVSLFDD
jgi:hypothetical protein